jgi:hypothetical protein
VFITSPDAIQGLARVDADPHVQLRDGAGLVARLDGVADAQSGSDGPLRVVLMRRRSAEHGDGRVADVLLDRRPEARERIHDQRLECDERVAHILDVSSLGRRRGVDEVREEDADELSLLGDRRRGKRCTARDAEAGMVGTFLAANGTNGHAHESRAHDRGLGNPR